MNTAEKADTAPLIVTALLPKDMAAWATGLRTAHFPPERNYLKAHVTLFHAIPHFCADELARVLALQAKTHSPIPARLEGLLNLGRGTALKLSSPAMLSVRDAIVEHFHGVLTAQDQHRPRLHITIQNKVSAAETKALQSQLEEQILPRDFTFRGMAMHYYRGGPWEEVKQFAFRGSTAA